MPDDVKILLQKFPSILRTGDMKPAPNHGVEHHIHTSSHPPHFCKILRPWSRKIANRQSGIKKVRIRWHCSQIKITMGFSFAHSTQKRRIVAALWRLPLFKFGETPHIAHKYPLPNMQDLSNGLHGCTIFSKIDLVKGYHQRWASYFQKVTSVDLVCWMGQNEHWKLSVADRPWVISAESCPLATKVTLKVIRWFFWQ